MWQTCHWPQGDYTLERETDNETVVIGHSKDHDGRNASEVLPPQTQGPEGTWHFQGQVREQTGLRTQV